MPLRLFFFLAGCPLARAWQKSSAQTCPQHLLLMPTILGQGGGREKSLMVGIPACQRACVCKWGVVVFAQGFDGL